MENKGRRFTGDTEEIKIYKPEKQKPDKGEKAPESVIEFKVIEKKTTPVKSEEDRAEEREERLEEKNSKKLFQHMKKHGVKDSATVSDELSHENDAEKDSSSGGFFSRFNLDRKRVNLAVIVVAVLFVIVFLYANSDRLSLHNISNFIRYGIFNSDSDERFPIDIQGENITAGNFQRMGQDLCYASDTVIMTANNYGKRLSVTQHSFTSPILVTSSERSLVYSLGGTGYRIGSGDETVFSGNADNNITVADIVDCGYYALVTQSDGYLSKLYVYDDDNRKVFTYSFADYYITSVSLSSNGRRVVLSGLSAMNGEEISALYVLDITRESPLYLQEFEDNIIYDVQFLNDTYACAVGSNAACAINTRSGRFGSTSYEGRSLTAFTVNKDTDTFTLSLSRSGDGRNCDIWSFRANGSLADSFETDLRVISLSTYKGRVALLTTESVCLYNKNGGFVSEKDAGIDPRAIVLYTTADAYVLDTSSIRTLTL